MTRQLEKLRVRLSPNIDNISSNPYSFKLANKSSHAKQFESQPFLLYYNIKKIKNKKQNESRNFNFHLMRELTQFDDCGSAHLTRSNLCKLGLDSSQSISYNTDLFELSCRIKRISTHADLINLISYTSGP